MADSVTVTGEGSTFIINKNAGFDGADGTDRETIFVAAAQVWADILVSSVPIVIDAEFSSSLYCNASSATLGSAGPLSTYLTSGASSIGLENNVWYPTALLNAYNGSDLFASSADISAQFNSDLGNSDCLSSSGWYYGLDGNAPSNLIDFYEVVLHELGHGLGFLSLVNSDGSMPNGAIDIFSTFLEDQDSSTSWSSMTDAARQASLLDDGNLVWSGAAVTALASDLSSGVNAGNVQMYAPSSYESGSSVSHFDTDLTPNELMEPQYTGGASYTHTTALFKDIGWTIVAASNDVPEITGQASLTVDEDNSLTITVADLVIADDDDSSFTLTVNDGANYSVSGATITPEIDFNGSLSVPVTVNDGETDSASFNLAITVNAVNDQPVIDSQSVLSVNEDTSLVLSLNDVSISDVDSSSFTFSVGSGVNYSVSDATITPEEDFNGVLTVPVTVSDGAADSDPFDLMVTVNAVNDAPVITGQSTLVTLESTALTIALSDLIITDPDDSSFTLAVYSGANYSVSGATITPTADFNGALTIPVTVNDGEVDSTTFNLLVTVSVLDNTPVITGQSTLTVNEDTSLTLSIADLTVVDADSDSFTLTVGSGDNYSVAGTTITPATDFYGTLTVPVTADDGQSESDSYDLTITVSPVNDAPVLSGSPGTSVFYTSSYSASFNAVDVDNTDLSYSVISQHDWLSIDNAGNLTGSPTVADIGEQSVTVSVSDGDLTDEMSFALTVADTSTVDLAVELAMSDHYFSINESKEVTITVVNLGPAVAVSGNAEILVEGATLTATGDSRCVLVAISSNQWRCDFTDLESSTTFDFSVASSSNSIITIEATAASELIELTEADNWRDTAAVIESAPTEPELPLNYASGINSQAVAFAELYDGNGTELLLANDLSADELKLSFDDDFSSVNLEQAFANNINARSVVAADFTGDNLVDVVFAGESASLFFEQLADNSWASAQLIDSRDSRHMLARDFNGDTFIDLVLVTATDNVLYVNDGSGQFTLAQTFGNAESTAADAFDYNQDGWPDIVIANADDDDLIYLNNAGQSNDVLSTSAIIVGSVLTDSQAVVVADIDNDGIENEIIVARTTAQGAPSLTVYQVSGSTLTSLLTLDAGDLISLAVGDYDANGESNLITLDSHGVVAIWELVGNRLERIQSFEVDDAQRVALFDVNDDGLPDLNVLTNSAAASVLYINTSITEQEGDSESDENTEEGETSSDEDSSNNNEPVVKTGVVGGPLVLLLFCLTVSFRYRARKPRQ